MYTKENCVATTPDIVFCTKVCVLELYERCEAQPRVGDDLCPPNLSCLPDKYGINRCLSEEDLTDFDIESLFS